jgi:hypothetical protein
MSGGDRPNWKRLTLHGGTCGAMVCLFFLAPHMGGRWHMELFRPYMLFLLGGIPVGIAAGALAALQILALWRRCPSWLCWPTGACLGGALFGLFSMLALEQVEFAIYTTSVWLFGWLFFCWRRST